MPPQKTLIYRTSNGIEIYTEPGRKSLHDFRVRYREPGKRVRTPLHIHIIVDLYQKLSAEPKLTNDFIDHIINGVIKPIVPSTSYPPSLQVFETVHISQFEGLSGASEYSPEFLLVVIELIMIQERTNYPDGNLNLQLFQKFRNGADIFSVVSAATFRGR